MTKPPPDIRRCTRQTKSGGRCRSARIHWWREIAMPDPEACKSHLTAAERLAYDEDWPRREAMGADFELWFVTLHASDPACWSWPAPDGQDMWAWQDGRCAICGDRVQLVTDHDHRTGLIRGQLCRSCNSLEGFGHGGVWSRYRERYPALICGLFERYWNPFTKEFAAPAAAYDPWRENPLRGVL